jgi:hypothetical protein
LWSRCVCRESIEPGCAACGDSGRINKRESEQYVS